MSALALLRRTASFQSILTVAALFPVQDVYTALMNHHGETPITAARWWDKPVYPITATSTETTLANLETVANSASPGDVIFLQAGTHSLDNIVITISGTVANPITIAAATLGACNLSESEIQIDGNFINVYGFVDARYDANGQDGVYAYAQRDAISGTDFVSDGFRNRFCYATLQGKTADDQYFNIVNTGTAIVDNRIDHNVFLRHESTSGGGSEIGQVGQNQLGTIYRALIDSNYIFEHLTDNLGDRTNPNEGETISIKSDRNWLINNVVQDGNSSMNIRAGRECAFVANWVLSHAGIEQTGGLRVGGRDGLVLSNYFDTLNDAQLNGKSCIEIDGGDVALGREAADDCEVAFNTAIQSKNVINLNRSGRPLKPTDVQLHSNALESKNATNVLWFNDSNTPNFGANVFGPNKGIADTDVLEALPEWTTRGGREEPTAAGNLDGTSDAVSTMGPIVRALSAAGALVDITGAVIAITGADIGAIQLGSNLSSDPAQAVIDRAGHAA